MADKQSAAFGVFPQMKPRRSAQDREAAKDMDVAMLRGFVSGVAGMPGDLESIGRLLLNIQGPENFVMPRTKEEGMAMLGQIFGANRVSLDTALPTSEDVEARLPFKSASETPVGRAVTGASQLAGGFYTGPGSAYRLVTGIPKAIGKAGKDFAMAAGQPATRMFIGPKAKTWDQAKAEAAARMEKAGVDPVDIWRQTGTFRGADGIQRQEISDVGARFLTDPERGEAAQVILSGIDVLKQKIKPTKQKDLFPRQLTEAKKGVRERINRAQDELWEYRSDPSQGVRAETIISHPELYKAYPELADMVVTTGGRGLSDSSMAQLATGKGVMEMDIFDPALRGSPTPIALHEMQHAVQTLEGMSPGGSKTTAFSDPKAFEILKRKRQELASPMTLDEFKKAWYGRAIPNMEKLEQEYAKYVKGYKVDPSIERIVQDEAAREYYNRLAGEAEARATEARIGMSPSQRQQEYPYSSYDVLEEDLITKPPSEYSGGGALVKAVRAAKKAAPAVEAPTVVIPSAVTRVQQAVRESKGDYGAKRVQRAADEIPNLERIYTEEALRSAFTGDNAQAMMTMNPADFERFAKELSGRTKADIGPKMAELARQGEIDKYTVPTDEYVQYLQRLRGGFTDLPFLDINKQEYGLPLMPFISGHEGRHRSRALAASGQPTSLVRLMPRAELREPFPRRTQEEYIEALRRELGLTDNMVIPQAGDNLPPRPAILLPEPYAKGGPAKGPLSGVRNK